MHARAMFKPKRETCARVYTGRWVLTARDSTIVTARGQDLHVGQRLARRAARPLLDRGRGDRDRGELEVRALLCGHVVLQRIGVVLEELDVGARLRRILGRGGRSGHEGEEGGERNGSGSRGRHDSDNASRALDLRVQTAA